MRPEPEEEVSGIATGLLAAMALVGLSPERALAGLHRGLKEIPKREGLSPGDIAYPWGKIENWPPGYAERWAIGYADGLARGTAKSLPAVLEVRRLPVFDDLRDRVAICADLARLDDWLDRVGTAECARGGAVRRGPGDCAGAAPEQG